MHIVHIQLETDGCKGNITDANGVDTGGQVGLGFLGVIATDGALVTTLDRVVHRHGLAVGFRICIRAGDLAFHLLDILLTPQLFLVGDHTAPQGHILHLVDHRDLGLDILLCPGINLTDAVGDALSNVIALAHDLGILIAGIGLGGLGRIVQIVFQRHASSLGLVIVQNTGRQVTGGCALGQYEHIRAVFLGDHFPDIVPVVGRELGEMLGQLAGAGDIDHDTGQLLLLIESKHQVKEVIRAGLITGEPFIVGLAVHHRMTVGGNAGGGLFGIIVAVSGATGVGDYRIAVAIGDTCVFTAVPGIHNGLGALIRKEFTVFAAGINILAVGGFLGGVGVRAAGMGVGCAQDDLIHRDFRAKLCHLLPGDPDHTATEHHHISGAENYHILISLVNHMRTYESKKKEKRQKFLK